MHRQYQKRWRASMEPVKVRLTVGERRRLGVSVGWAVLSPRPVQPVDGWQAVHVWVTGPPDLRNRGSWPAPPPAARARGAVWYAGILYAPTWRTVQRERRKARARNTRRRGW